MVLGDDPDESLEGGPSPATLAPEDGPRTHTETLLELESELGSVRIEARTALSTFMIMGKADGLPVDFNLQQGGARYT